MSASIKSGDVVGIAGVELHSALVAGAAADTDMAVTGLSWAKNPQFVAVLHISTAAAIATMADIASEVAEGTDDNDVQLTDTDITSDQLLLIWVQEG